MDNTYDEKYYLDNSEYLEVFYKKQSLIKLSRTMQEVFYKDTLIKYDDFLNRLSIFLKSLDYKDSIFYSLALSYLIHEGFLSYDLSFEAKDEEDKITCKYGTSIISGYGCCRNFSDIHKDIMQRLGLYVKSFYCYQGIKNNFALSRKSKANHVINLIDYENTLYGIDLYNADKLYSFKSSFLMKDISFDSSYLLRYKPYYEILTNESSIEDIKETIKAFEIESSKNHIGPYEYIDDIKVKYLEYLKSQRDLFMDFHNETKELKRQIVLE